MDLPTWSIAQIESPFAFDGFCLFCGGRVIGENGEILNNCICKDTMKTKE